MTQWIFLCGYNPLGLGDAFPFGIADWNVKNGYSRYQPVGGAAGQCCTTATLRNGAIYQIIPIVVTTDDGNVQHQQFTGVHLSPCTPFSEPRYSTQPHKKTEAY